MAALRAAEIGCAIYYPIPLHRQDVFAGEYRDRTLPVAEQVAAECLSLPIFPEITDAQVDRVIEVIGDALQG